ncbi:MAG: gamma-glutamyl-gamma-aminobutyrate hydrolase family protein [Deltaproteobacteria bacterium]|nr:gamma-glutamyl-gamma-aminobutyrate hydrolase family protein [Deltaproteobacteria bacterium]
MSVSAKPVIGISSHIAKLRDHSGRARTFFRVVAQYARAVKDAGGLPVLLPSHQEFASDPGEVVKAIDGLLLSGGTDLPAGAFTTQLEPTLREMDPERYDYEVQLVREAYKSGMPIMGICRGHQTLVEALGGSLTLNIHVEGRGRLDHYQHLSPEIPSHEIELRPGTFPAQCLGPRARVNSFHRQAVADVPDGFTAAAFSEDGVIEAVSAVEPFVLGLQFHPEWLYPDEPKFLQLFEELINQARRFSAPA